jgi:hypothetical protein
VTREELPLWLTTILDMVVGSVPLVGDAVDVAEVAYGFATGKDRWGRPLSNLDLMFMTIGMLLPLVSAPMAEGLGRKLADLTTVGGSADVLVGRFLGDGELPLALVLDQVEKAGSWSALKQVQRQAAIDEVRELVTLGASNLGPKLQGAFLRPEDLMDEAQRQMRSRGLAWNFGQWQARRRSAGLSDDLATFVSDGARGRARVVLQTLCGNEAVGAGIDRARRAAKGSTNYPSLGHIEIGAGAPGQQWLTDRLHMVWEGLPFHVEQRPHPRLVDGFSSGSLTLVPAEIPGHSSDEYVDLFRALLANLSASGNADAVTQHELRGLIGNQVLHPRDLMALFAQITDILDHDLSRMGVNLDLMLPPEGTGQRALKGLASYYQNFITHSGYEFSTRAEGRAIGHFLSHGHPVEMMRLGLPLPVLKKGQVAGVGLGPDIPLYRVESGRLVADCAEVKSSKDLERLAGERLWWDPRAKKWRMPELLRQTWSTLERAAIEQFVVEGPTGIDSYGWLSGRFIYVIDEQRAWAEFDMRRWKTTQAFSDWLMETLAPTVEDQFTEAFMDPGVRAQIGIPDDMEISLEVVIL